MRRALLKQLPAITRFYGLKPWDLPEFTVDELNEYLRQMEDFNRRAEHEARQAQRRRRR